jgi:hypothetical protein
VKVNASTVDPVLYSLKPGVAIFSVESISSGSTSGSTSSHHHRHVDSMHSISHSSIDHSGGGSSDHSGGHGASASAGDGKASASTD